MASNLRGAILPFLWLGYLVVGLALPLTYFLQAPSPAGPGLLHLFGWGALAGLAVGGFVCRLVWPLHEPTGLLAKLKLVLGISSLGLLGGATGAAWLDQSHVVEEQLVQLPVVALVQMPARRHSSGIEVETLDPADPTRAETIAVEKIDGDPQEGSCLGGVVRRGWLGGRWFRRFAAIPCSPARGQGSAVLVFGPDLANWRWHAPGPSRRLGWRAVEDDALAPGVSCRTRPGEWLFLCSAPS